MQHDDLEAQALALLQTFPPPARSSPGIMQAVESILATSSQPHKDLEALKDRSWAVYLAQFTDQSSHTTIYAPTTYIVNSFNRGSYNRDSFNDDHSDRSTTTTTEIEPNWGRGLLFALLAFAAWVLGSSSGYLDGLNDGHRHQVEVQP